MTPQSPLSADLVDLYAKRIQHTGADIMPALRNRRALFATSAERSIGYLAATAPAIDNPVPVGRGTSTHRQALDALNASQWALNVGKLPAPERIRVTRAVGAFGRVRSRRSPRDVAYRQHGVASRLAAAISSLSRPVEPGRYTDDRRGDLEPSTA